MIAVNKVLPRGQGLSPVLLKRAATVVLDWDVRQKSRFDAVDSSGRAVAVFLARGQVVRGGDVLVAEDGSLLRVVAEPQPVMVVRACAEHGAPFDVMRAAYHLGNRHVPLQLAPDHLKLEPDHVLAAMLRRMHLIVTDDVAAFEPESGAYAEGPAAHPSHGHSGHGHADDDRSDLAHAAPGDASHGHAAHDHAAHGHASHDHASHGHASHDHASHGHASHDHAAHGHAAHGDDHAAHRPAARQHAQGDGTIDLLPKPATSHEPSEPPPGRA